VEKVAIAEGLAPALDAHGGGRVAHKRNHTAFARTATDGVHVLPAETVALDVDVLAGAAAAGATDAEADGSDLLETAEARYLTVECGAAPAGRRATA
jgi:hypothetical protein